MKLLLLFMSLALATTAAHPMGPDGVDLPTLCKANPRMRLSPVCKEFLLPQERDSPILLMIPLFCQELYQDFVTCVNNSLI
jgi:hypothetical protein